ncbi:hypothetical protein BDZ89DRAFT_1200413 [Hymenopellis radicata]|nr:hypothetical protein BDZ89DRAFT_1200413 [Hymenopellis radicata]
MASSYLLSDGKDGKIDTPPFGDLTLASEFLNFFNGDDLIYGMRQVEGGEDGDGRGILAQLALQWVQEHITKFGRDPSRVTIWGDKGVAEMSFHYGNIRVRTAVFTTENRPLRFASAEIFVCLLKLAFICDDDTLSHSVQSQWLSRLFRRQLSPIPAIEMGFRES